MTTRTIPLLNEGDPFPGDPILVGVSMQRLAERHDMRADLAQHLDGDPSEPLAMRPNYKAEVIEFSFEDERAAFEFKLRWG